MDGPIQPKLRILETGDILRETQLSQFYRYDMGITTFSGFQK